MTIKFLNPIIECKKCIHYMNPRLPRYSGQCNIHVCAAYDEEGYEKLSSYPEVSEVWLEHGENHAAKYCGEFELKYHAKTED